jgi:AmmeMemoRadiSam system protein B/AmmeMemoRadiSam system protein A
MKRTLCLLAAVSLALAAPATREPAVAGAFYPANAQELAAMVDGFLAAAHPPAVHDPVALIAPHAGYVYSGPVAGHAYALLKGRRYTRVVVLAPSHYEAFDYASVYDGAAYSTPLGRIQIDRAFSEKLVAAGGRRLKLSATGHTVSADKREHAIEVQLPFLQRTLGSFALVAVVMGAQDYASERAVGAALAKLAGPDTLIVASSDLSHYHPYNQAVALDRKTLRAVSEWDYLSLSLNLERQVWEACGGAPIVAAMIAAERLGAARATLLHYANSGDTAGDKSRVVGYGAVAFERAPGAGAATFDLSPQEKSELLSLARRSVESAVKENKLLNYPAPATGHLSEERGAFVTLKENGQLRGCIGYTAPLKPLALVVRDVAAYAAVQDRRFPPVTPEELPRLTYEISVLGPLRRVADTRAIVLGLHGLVMLRGEDEGLLLPQVATEQRWDRRTFLEETCQKAGMEPAAWRDPATDIFSFTALVFGDSTRAR